MFRQSEFSSVQSPCHSVITSKFSSNIFFAVTQSGLRDLSRSLPPIAPGPVCTGKFVLSSISVHSRMRAYSLRVFGGAILLSTGSHFDSYAFNSFG